MDLVAAVGSAQVSRLLVFGDLHCDRHHLRGLVERAVEERCDALMSLGDLNYLPREPEGRRFLRSSAALLRRVGLELLLVDGNHDDAEALARADARTRAPGPVRLGFGLHHLPAGTRFRLGRLRCLAYGGRQSCTPVAAGTGRLRSSGGLRAPRQRRRDRPPLLPRPTHARARHARSRPFRGAGRETPPSGRLLRAPAPPARECHGTGRTRRARILAARRVLGRSAR